MGRPRNADKQGSSTRRSSTIDSGNGFTTRRCLGDILQETYNDMFIYTDQWPRSAFAASLRGYLQDHALELENVKVDDEKEPEHSTTCGPEVYSLMVPILTREVLSTIRSQFSGLSKFQNNLSDDSESVQQDEATRPRFLPIALIRDRGEPNMQKWRENRQRPAMENLDRDTQRQILKHWMGFHPLACLFDEGDDFYLDLTAVQSEPSSDNRVHPAARALILSEGLLTAAHESNDDLHRRQAEWMLDQSHQLFAVGTTNADGFGKEDEERDLAACKAAALLAWHHLAHLRARRGMAYFAVACQLLSRHGRASASSNSYNDEDFGNNRAASKHKLLESILFSITVWAFSQLDRSTSQVIAQNRELHLSSVASSYKPIVPTGHTFMQATWGCTIHVASLGSFVLERHPQTKSALPTMSSNDRSITDVCTALYDQLASSNPGSSKGTAQEHTANNLAGDVFYAAASCAKTFIMLCLLFPRSSPLQPEVGKHATEVMERFVAIIKALEEARKSPSRRAQGASKHPVLSKLAHHVDRPKKESTAVSPLMNMTQEEAGMLGVVVTIHLSACLSSIERLALASDSDEKLMSKLLALTTNLSQLSHSPWLSSDNEEINEIRAGLDEAQSRLASRSRASSILQHFPLPSSSSSPTSDAASTLASLDMDQFVPDWSPPSMFSQATTPSFFGMYNIQEATTFEIRGEKGQDDTLSSTIEWLQPLWGAYNQGWDLQQPELPIDLQDQDEEILVTQ